MKPSLANFFYPRQSPEVRAIYENLTPDESVRLRNYSLGWGLLGGLACGVVFGASFWLIVAALPTIPLVWRIVFGVIAMNLAAPLAGMIIGAPFRSRLKTMLCDSSYAKARGYTPKNLRLFRFTHRVAEPSDAAESR